MHTRLLTFHSFLNQSHLPESNQRPTDYKSVALPSELKWLKIKELVSLISEGTAKVENFLTRANNF